MKVFKKEEVPDLPFKKATKRPIPIECIQVDEPFIVETMEGTMQGKAGDYLIIGIKGEMYPCDKEIFEETYELLKAKKES